MSKICVCISCFNCYETRMKGVVEYFNDNHYSTKYFISNFNHYDKEYYTVNYPNTTQIQVPRYAKNLSISRLRSHYVFSKEVFALLKKTKPDVIYCIFPPNTLVRSVIKYKKITQCKVILDCYDTWPESFPTKRFSKLLSWPFSIWANIRNRYISEADLILCVSQVGVDFIKKIAPNTPAKLFMPVIDAQEFLQYNDDTSKLTFCYLGNINHITDINLLNLILKGVAKRKKVCLHIIGEGQNYLALKELLTDSGIDVIGHGIVFDIKEKMKIYSLFNLAINVPKEEIQSTMSLKSVEYISMGLPFINSAGGDTQCLVENYQIGINIDKNNLARTIEQIAILTPKELRCLHDNTVYLYNSKFAKQDLNIILKD